MVAGGRLAANWLATRINPTFRCMLASILSKSKLALWPGNCCRIDDKVTGPASVARLIAALNSCCDCWDVSP